MDWALIEDSIRRAGGDRFRVHRATPVAGGDINRAFCLQGDGGRYFVKLNRAARAAMFAAEAEALRALGRCAALHVPAPVCHGVAAGQAFLVLEYIPLRPLDERGQRALGEALAALHETGAERFGWHRDNTIGTTPQINDWSCSWIEFWRERRLAPQLRLAAQNGAAALARAGERLLDGLGTLLQGHAPPPALVHGDLWSGNAAMDDAGRPVIFDPAAYYGDRETDLAMMELFGGFGTALDAYRAAWPVDEDYELIRRPLYQLYHVLNHFNLFGGGYGASAQSLIDRLSNASYRR